VLGSEWTTTSTITLTITQYRFELREHRHLCRSYTTLFTRHDIVMRPDRQYPGGDRVPAGTGGSGPLRAANILASHRIGWRSMEVTPAVEEPLEAAHDGPSVEMLDEFIPACAAGRA
jgi:hypothetical protein